MSDQTQPSAQELPPEAKPDASRADPESLPDMDATPSSRLPDQDRERRDDAGRQGLADKVFGE